MPIKACKTLSLEASLITESGDENASNRSEVRVRVWYSAPNLLRYEPAGGKGMLQVADGSHLHTCFARMHGHDGRQYASAPLEGTRPPHLFRPDFPFAGGDEAFLFPNIDEGAASAEILREEQGCFVLSVAYQPLRHSGIILTGPHVLFWIDASNRMVMRQEGQVGHRFPAEDEVTWSRHSMAVREMLVSQPIAGEVFRFIPPPDAVPETSGSCVSVSGGGGFIETSAGNQNRLEHRGSHHREGETLVEVSKWRWRGIDLTFERRMTRSDDGAELRVDERVSGPQGKAGMECKLAVSERAGED